MEEKKPYMSKRVEDLTGEELYQIVFQAVKTALSMTAVKVK